MNDTWFRILRELRKYEYGEMGNELDMYNRGK